LRYDIVAAVFNRRGKRITECPYCTAVKNRPTAGYRALDPAVTLRGGRIAGGAPQPLQLGVQREVGGVQRVVPFARNMRLCDFGSG